MTENIKTISLAFGYGISELSIPEKNMSSIILPSESEIKEDPFSLVKKALDLGLIK